MDWINSAQEYFAVLFGSGPEYEVVDVPGELLKLHVELRALHESLANQRARLNQLRRPPPRALAGASVSSGRLENAPAAAPQPAQHTAELTDRARRVADTLQTIAHHDKQIRLLRLRSNRPLYIAGTFLFLYLLYLLLNGHPRTRFPYSPPTEAPAPAETPAATPAP